MGHKSVQDSLLVSAYIFLKKVTKPKLNWSNWALSIAHFSVRFVFCMLYGPTTLEFTRGPGYELSGYVATRDRHFCFWNLQRAIQQNFAQ